MKRILKSTKSIIDNIKEEICSINEENDRKLKTKEEELIKEIEEFAEITKKFFDI